MINLFYKFFDKKKYYNKKIIEKDKISKLRYIKIIRPKLKLIQKNVKNETVSFLHSGHLGDIIYSLPVIKEISKNRRTILYIEANKKIINNQDKNHPFGDLFLTTESVNKIIPLLKQQDYINNVFIYNQEPIDVDLNFFRELGINFNTDSPRWYFHLTGIHCNLNKPYLFVGKNINFKNKIIIVRSSRRQNNFIEYNFLNNYKDILFLGLKEEFQLLKKDLPLLEYYETQNFLELAEIINSCKIFIGNISFGYSIAEALKVPRLLESHPNSPFVNPSGDNAYEFYFQEHFEYLFKKLILKFN